MASRRLTTYERNAAARRFCRECGRPLPVDTPVRYHRCPGCRAALAARKRQRAHAAYLRRQTRGES